MGEEAKIVLQLENAEEVLQLLRDLKEIAGQAGGGVSPAGGGSSSQAKGSSSSIAGAAPFAAAPQNPYAQMAGLAPGVMGQNAATFGTWNSATGQMQPLAFDPTRGQFINTATGMGIAGYGFPGMGGGGAGGGQDPKSPGMLGQMAAAAGGMHAVNQLAGIASQGLGGYASAQANNAPYYSGGMVPGVVSAGFTIGGGLIGAAFGAPLVGAGIGAVAGSVYSSYVAPRFETGALEHQAGVIAASLGIDPRSSGLTSDISQDALKKMASMMLSGQSPAMGMILPKYNQMVPGVRDVYAEAALKGIYSTAGAERLRASVASGATMSTEDYLYGTSSGNELQASVALAAAKDPRAGEVQANFFKRTLLDEDIATGAAEVGLSSTKYGLTARYKGSKAAFGAMADAQGSMANEASLLRQRANYERQYGSAGAARRLEIQAEQMELQAATAPEVAFSALSSENSALGALETGRANRGFEKALYSGASAGQLPWDKRAGALSGAASRLEAERNARRSAGLLSPAQDMQYQEQIESLQYQATEGIAREREGMMNREAISESGLGIAKLTRERTPGILTASAEGQVSGQANLQLETLNRQEAVLQKILDTSRYLTHEQKTQLQTQIENLATEKERVKIQRVSAEASAAYRTGETRIIEGAVGSQVRLIEGAGGAEGIEAGGALLAGTDAKIEAKKAQMQKLLTTFDWNSDEVQGVRRELAGMEVGRANQKRGLAVAPMSADLRGDRAELSVAEAYIGMGYGSFGDMRALSMAKVGMDRRRLEEIEGGKASFIRQFGAKEWTPAMDADYREAKAGAMGSALQSVQQYNEGWDQRLISSAYGMPQNGRLLMTRFTNREAAAAGVLHSAFGGNEDQSRLQREMFPRFMRAMGSGNPGNYADRAMGGTQSVVEVKITLGGDRALVASSGVQVTQQKTAHDVHVNAHAAKVPGG